MARCRSRGHPPDTQNDWRRLQRHHPRGERGMSDSYAGTFDETYGETDSEQRARERGNGSAGRRIRFHLRPFEAITLSTAPNYCVKGVIPRTGLVVVWGPPKCGKSFWTFDLVMHVALGRKYRERKVQQGTVVYFALE